MGAMICKIHGRVGFVETCAHVAKEIDEGKPPNGRHLNIATDLLVCDSCYSSLELERFAWLADGSLDERIDKWVKMDKDCEQAFDAAYNGIEGRRSFCAKCVAELENRRADNAARSADQI